MSCGNVTGDAAVASFEVSVRGWGASSRRGLRKSPRRENNLAYENT